jgi:pyruvate ferredoxin oxidoreductase gamma subunit
MLAKAALASGLKAQAYTPEVFGPGDGHSAYARVSKAEIAKKGPVDSADFHLYFDDEMFKQDLKAFPERAVVVLNTKEKFASPLLKKKKIKLLTLDATGLALQLIGRPWPAAPMLGALLKGWNKVGIKALKNAVEAEAGDKVAEQSKATEEGMKIAR